MTDYVWPADLEPYRCTFYLQPHVGGTQSPFTRTRKVYGLSAPLWVAQLSLRGGYDSAPRLNDPSGYGARLDAFIAELEGGLNRVALYDFRRPRPLQTRIGDALFTVAAAARGADSLQVSGFPPNGIAFTIGDYVGGDGRPHIVTGGSSLVGAGTILADGAGVAAITIKPPLSAAIEDGAALEPGVGMFRLTTEDAGHNLTEVGQFTEYSLTFVEDPY